MTGTRTDGRLERGRQTRRLVLARTMEIASVEGLEGLSIGRVATELGLSKSGVFALFGSKEELQLATVRAATAVYVRHVVHPAEELPAGLGRVCALSRNWLAYSRQRVFPGGCFFFSSAVEFGARQGAVHDAVAARRAEWTDYVRRTLAEARGLGELRPDTDVEQLAFELIALLETANVQSVLSGDDAGYDRAAAGMLARLRAAATDPGALPGTLVG
ncbi:TetR/AcrR family transcriptional regulator [Streptomyces aidingensis]|uniref:DNA-binding transcriptional regulator, AcrR family n=1 Tax=Streptomyces aidingensis TaxID=910347 RepID=A0A1I1P9F8_9ACTN|nr:TetR/AcrR family transcriptional regulator [Streptomyces aidingensis]SFD06326.1 DNA-binding transcriptional regulator, AcrR family [Streptomyces aidingensis]